MKRTNILLLLIALPIIVLNSSCMAEDSRQATTLIPSTTGLKNAVVKKSKLPDSESLDIQIKDNKVSVRLENAVLNSVLANIGNKTGISVQSMDQASRLKVSHEFSQLPLEEALHVLLKESNYALEYGQGTEGRRVTKIFVFSPVNIPVLKQNKNIADLADIDLQLELENLKPGMIPDNLRDELLSAIKSKGPAIDQHDHIMQKEALTNMLKQIEAQVGKDSIAVKVIQNHLRQQAQGQ